MRERSDVVFFGIGGHVVAVDAGTGKEIWRTKLSWAGLVTIHATRDAVFAGASGELFCLDPSTGVLRWKNPLPGLGVGLVAFSESSGAAASAAVDAVSD